MDRSASSRASRVNGPRGDRLARSSHCLHVCRASAKWRGRILQTNIILAPGAYEDGSMWTKVNRLLQANEFRVTGCGGSSSPVKFVAMPTVGEVLARAASEAVLIVGPLRVGLKR
jgi:hypothetical protein